MPVVVKDMAVSREDFVRLLPKALDGWPYRVDDNTVIVGTADSGALITMPPLPPRRFGPVAIDRTEVTIAFHGLAESAQHRFLTRFDRAFQRGGG